VYKPVEVYLTQLNKKKWHIRNSITNSETKTIAYKSFSIGTEVF